MALVILITGAYFNGLTTPLVFDDASIFGDASAAQGLAGRPVVRATMGLSRRLGQILPAAAVAGHPELPYHLVNVALHAMAALVLMGLVRRTLLLPVFRDRFRQSAWAIAAVIAAIWAFTRSRPRRSRTSPGESNRPPDFSICWCSIARCVPAAGRASHGGAAAIVACALGMAADQSMATAPILLLLFEGLLVSESWSGLLRRRWRFYAMLAATWAILAWSLWSAGTRGGTMWAVRLAHPAGPDTPLTPWAYFNSELGVVLKYLGLTLWPHNLCLVYDWPVADNAGQVLPGASVLGAILAATVVALALRSPWALPGLWFLLVLLPTSSFIPMRDLAVERRMYLPLAAAVAVAVLALAVLATWLLPRLGNAWRQPLLARFAALLAVVSVVGALGLASHFQNRLYASELSIWQETVSTQPNSSLVRLNLALACAAPPTSPAALAELGHVKTPDRVLAAEVFTTCGMVLGKRFVREKDAKDDFVRQQAARDGFGAMRMFSLAIAMRPDDSEAWEKRGMTHQLLHDPKDALQDLNAALRLRPDFLLAHQNRAEVALELSKYARYGRAAGNESPGLGRLSLLQEPVQRTVGP